MKALFVQVWSLMSLSNWVALLLLVLIVSVPIRQCMAASDAILIEQLELNDGETEQESEKEIQKIDGDEFLVEKSVTFSEALHSTYPGKKNFGIINSIFLNIFDPPPESTILP